MLKILIRGFYKMAENKPIKDYTKKAIKKYKDKHDIISVMLPLGTKDDIRSLTGKSVNSFINEIIEKELNILRAKKPEEDPNDPRNIFVNYKG